MKQTPLRMLAVAGVVYATTNVVHAQQVPLPTTTAEGRGPVPGTAMTKSLSQKFIKDYIAFAT